MLWGLLVGILLHAIYQGGYSQCQTGAVWYYDWLYGDVCYWILSLNIPKNAEDSQAACRSENGDLAYIPNALALDKVTQLLSDNAVNKSGWYAYLGYTRVNKTLLLDMQENRLYQTWIPWDNLMGQPLSTSLNCIAIYGFSGYWHDMHCSNNVYAICSTPRPIVTTTTEQPTTTTTTTTEDPTTTTTTTTEQPTTTTTTTTTEQPTTTTTTTTEQPTTTTTTTTEQPTTTTTTTTEQPTTTTTTTTEQPTTTTTTTTEQPTTSTTTTTEQPTTTTTTTEQPTTTTTTTTEQPTTTTTTTTEQPKTTIHDLTTSGEIDCWCPCDHSDPVQYYSVVNITKELQTKLDSLKEETKVDEETLSSTIRKRTSASDSRPSSAYVGFLGIVLLSIIFGGFLIADLSTVIMALKDIF